MLLCAAPKRGHPTPTRTAASTHFKNAPHADFEGAGHWSHHDKLDVFMGHLDKFLRERWVYSAAWLPPI